MHVYHLTPARLSHWPSSTSILTLARRYFFSSFRQHNVAVEEIPLPPWHSHCGDRRGKSEVAFAFQFSHIPKPPSRTTGSMGCVWRQGARYDKLVRVRQVCHLFTVGCNIWPSFSAHTHTHGYPSCCGVDFVGSVLARGVPLAPVTVSRWMINKSILYCGA